MGLDTEFQLEAGLPPALTPWLSDAGTQAHASAVLWDQTERLARAQQERCQGLLDAVSAFAEPIDEGHDGVPGARSFRVSGVSLTLHHDAQTQLLGFYADMGPAPDASAAVSDEQLRWLLECNLERRHGDVQFGLHPVSGHLVAFLRMLPTALDDSPERCWRRMEDLAAVVNQVRDAF